MFPKSQKRFRQFIFGFVFAFGCSRRHGQTRTWSCGDVLHARLDRRLLLMMKASASVDGIDEVVEARGLGPLSSFESHIWPLASAAVPRVSVVC